MPILSAKNLTLDQVHQLLGFQEQEAQPFAAFFDLEPISEWERQEILQTRSDFKNHFSSGKISEGQVKLVTIDPLLRLAGFYRHPLQVEVEEGIARIEVEDEDAIVTGRFDILAIHQTKRTIANTAFWVLVVESKKGSISPSAGLPQLLTYAYRSIQHQSCVWGLVTNGEYYRFVYVQPGEVPMYQLLPSLNLLDVGAAVQLLQVLKAIRVRSMSESI